MVQDVRSIGILLSNTLSPNCGKFLCSLSTGERRRILYQSLPTFIGGTHLAMLRILLTTATGDVSGIVRGIKPVRQCLSLGRVLRKVHGYPL